MKLVSLVVRLTWTAFLLACVTGSMGAVSASAQNGPTGIPVPEDSPLFAAFRQLEKQPAYRMTMTAESSDPQIAQMAAMGMGPSPAETVVQGGARQVTMHIKMPAMDQPGTIDDWEIRAVVRNGRGARLITSPAVPRIMKLSAQMLAMQLAMLNHQAGMAIARAAAQGPLGAINMGMIAGVTAMANIEAPRMLKKEKDFFSWQCMPQLADGPSEDRKTSQLTDLRLIGDQTVEGTAATAYQFYVREGDQFQGPLRLLVAKDSLLPLRIEITVPQMHGSMRIDYSFDKINDIEIPACLASGQ